jgi:hypothetical protein
MAMGRALTASKPYQVYSAKINDGNGIKPIYSGCN